MVDWDSGPERMGAIPAAATPPALGLAPIRLVKYQQRIRGNFWREKVKGGPESTEGTDLGEHTLCHIFAWGKQRLLVCLDLLG